MDHELQTMPKALRLLADQINAPDHVPAMCLRDAAAMIESLAMQRSQLRNAINAINAAWLADDGTAQTELAIDDAINAATAMANDADEPRART